MEVVIAAQKVSFFFDILYLGDVESEGVHVRVDIQKPS